MTIDGVNGTSGLTNNGTSSVVQTERKVQEVVKAGTPAAIGPEKNQSIQNNELGQGNQEEQIKSAVSAANQKIRMTNTRCEFEYHEKTKRVSIKVIDTENDEVIREIPPEETLEMVEKLWELAGLIVDEKC